MTVRDMKKEREYTLKHHLIVFLLYVIGSMLCLNVFTLLFGMDNNRRNRSAAENINLLNDYSVIMEDVMGKLRQYTQYSTENEEDYQQISGELENGNTILGELFSHTNDTDTLRSLRDIIEVHNQLTEKIVNIHNEMSDGKIDVPLVNERYKETEAIYEILCEEYSVTNQMYLTYINAVSEKQADKNLQFTICYCLISIGIGISLWTEIKKIYRSVLVPVQELVRKADQVQRGIFEPVQLEGQRIRIDREIALLLQTFNHMTMQMKHQIEVLEENIRIQKQLEESRFRELQMQINPHFMFNTLNMISETAYFENAKKTVFLLNKTAKMFRFSLDFSGTSVTLFREMEELENYILIQEQQYGDRIEFRFELDESFHHILVPSLTLQPLIENSISHGVGKYTGGGWVKLTTRYCDEEKAGYIVVEDNGVGMEEEQLKQVKDEMQNYGGGSMKIGLGNVYSRLKMLYGEKFSMDIESFLNRGTKITIRIECERGKVSCTGSL